jgi:phage gp36-like protein
MPYLLLEDLATHLYGENTAEIIRGDYAIVTTAIEAGVAEAKSYLSRYNLTKLFDPLATGYFADVNLQNKVKDIVCWHLVKLANPNINLELFRTGYEDAIDWFKQVQKGAADPDGWPYKDDDTATDYPEGSGVSMISNTKRSNLY